MIWNSIWMSAGYALMIIVFAGFLALLGWIGIQLFVLTLDNPLFYILDALVVTALIYLVTRKRFREGLREFWKQILRSY